MSDIEEQYRDFDKMDYVIVTKESTTIGETIASIRKQDNVNAIRVIASSKCSVPYKRWLATMHILNKIDSLLFEDVGLAYARMCGIDSVTTPWLVFVDDDIILPDDWSKDMLWFIRTQGGAISSLGGVVARGYRNNAHKALIERDKVVKYITERMFTYGTMIRLEAVEDWSPDMKTHAYEDYMMTQHIIKKNYKCLSLPVSIYHKHSGSDFRTGCWNGAGGRQTGRFKNFRSMLKYVIRLVGGGIKQTFKMNNDWFALYAMKVGLGVVWGYLRWKKYLIKKV